MAEELDIILPGLMLGLVGFAYAVTVVFKLGLDYWIFNSFGFEIPFIGIKPLLIVS